MSQPLNLNQNKNSKTRERKLARRRRTNILLTTVSLVFFIAWAPIHVYLILVDVLSYSQDQVNSQLLLLLYQIYFHQKVCFFPVFKNTFQKSPSKEDEQRALVLFASFHIIAMTTVCVNPLLYGWCNRNFKEVCVK